MPQQPIKPENVCSNTDPIARPEVVAVAARRKAALPLSLSLRPGADW
jgi:hypothetical protein